MHLHRMEPVFKSRGFFFPKPTGDVRGYRTDSNGYVRGRVMPREYAVRKGSVRMRALDYPGFRMPVDFETAVCIGVSILGIDSDINAFTLQRSGLDLTAGLFKVPESYLSRSSPMFNSEEKYHMVLGKQYSKELFTNIEIF